MATKNEKKKSAKQLRKDAYGTARVLRGHVGQYGGVKTPAGKSLAESAKRHARAGNKAGHQEQTEKSLKAIQKTLQKGKKK